MQQKSGGPKQHQSPDIYCMDNKYILCSVERRNAYKLAQQNNTILTPIALMFHETALVSWINLLTPHLKTDTILGKSSLLLLPVP